MARLAMRGAVFAVLAALAATGLYLALRQTPILVDVARVERGPMEVTVSEEGMARVRDVFSVSSPVAGHLDRITLKEGDRVEAGETVIALIHPLDPPFLDDRTRAELVAAVGAARSAVALATVEHARALTALEQAQSDYDRAAKLAESDFLPQSMLEKSRSDLRLQKAAVASAQANIALKQSELASAEARLTQPDSRGSQTRPAGCCVKIAAPVDGVVLAVAVRSAQAIATGERLVDIGDPRNLEVTVDLLSKDAVRVEQGARATISDWGGEGELKATVRRIEPAAFTKVSALGIEEQRVNALLDLDSVPERLGHGYRVVVHVGIWSGDDVLQVPIGSLFRSGGKWAVFAMEDGAARLRTIEIGRMNASSAQVLQGLTAGQTVILYPNDQLADGSEVEERPLAQ